MKRASILITLFCSLFFSSCYKYYIYHTKCDDRVSNTENNYIFENDTIKIVYDFWKVQGKMNFELYNKLSVPIFIDWKNSSLLINDIKYSYWAETETKISSGKGSSEHHLEKTIPPYQQQPQTSVVGSINMVGVSVSIKEERVTVMPPHSKLIKLAGVTLHPLPFPEFKNFKMTFRNFIAYSLTEDVKNDIYIDNKFYVNKVEMFKRDMPKDKKIAKDFYTLLIN